MIFRGWILFALLGAHINWAQESASSDNAGAGVDPKLFRFKDPNQYSFNPIGVKRDPFAPPVSATKGSMNSLQRFDLNQISLVGILTGIGAPQAMVVLPDKSTHIVQVGDQIGRRKGVVAKISTNEIVVRETFRDYQNRSTTETTSLVLAQ
jgi:Tfp pilus assembly protein PilP